MRCEGRTAPIRAILADRRSILSRGVVRLNSESVAGAHQDGERDGWREYQRHQQPLLDSGLIMAHSTSHGRQTLPRTRQKGAGLFRKYTETP